MAKALFTRGAKSALAMLLDFCMTGNQKIRIIKHVISPLALICSAAVWGSDMERGGRGKEQTNRDYSPVGIRAGSFMIHPFFENQNEYKDNIYSQQDNTRDDFIFHLQPGVNAKSNWNRHALEANVSTDVQLYASHNTEDKENYTFDLNGRLDVLQDSFATAKFYHAHQYEDRGSPDSPSSALEPVQYDTTGGAIGYEHKINRIRLNVLNDTQHLDYENSISRNSTFINNDDRDRQKNTSTGRISYEIMPGYEAFVRGSYNFIDYDQKFDDYGLQRSSDGYEAVVGIALDLTGKLVGDAYIGYATQKYDDAQLQTISDITGGFGLKWIPTGLTTISARIDRTINETTQGFSSGFFSTASTVSIDHELLRNVLLNASAGYIYNDYKGGQERQEDTYYVGISAKYLLNRNFFLTSGYNFRTRSTANVSNADYDINSVYFSLGAQL
ncbi:outer membrane beta-barrel protein [Methylobacter sp.]|uniref:outer membrane beta-barrel protein n=1 Tax=Methylobacter sp. TaxID=2051955 RepID=UPI003DA660AB